jgi:iron complex outermembrane recepter protein
MGGLFKYVTKDPSTSAFSARAEFGAGGVEGGAKPSYSARLSANIPAGEELAFRVSGFFRRDAGYVDNITSGADDVNKADNVGLRVAALWRLSNVTSVRFSGLYQSSKAFGAPDVQLRTGLGDLEQAYAAGAGRSRRVTGSLSATLDTQVAGVDLVYISAYNYNEYQGLLDRSVNFSTQAQAQFGVSGALTQSKFTTKKIVQELRASRSFGFVEALAGFFFTDETNPKRQSTFATDPLTGRFVGNLGDSPQDTDYVEYAAFGDLTFRFSDRFDVQVGGRQSWIDFTEHANTTTGLFAGQIPEMPLKDQVFTYLVSPRYKLTADIIVYGRAASGYRPGRANRPFVVAEGGAAAAAPDKTYNYEVGVKGDLSAAISVEASVYYIDWRNIQLSLLTSRGNAYGANGGRAASKGVEFATTVRPWRRAKVYGWVSYDEAELTEDLPATATVKGKKGDRLANSSPWSGHIAVDQNFPIGDATLTLGAAASFVGQRYDVFTGSGVRRILPSYERFDLHADVDFGSWKLTAYMNNLTDQRALIGFGETGLTSDIRTYIQPRTFGLVVAKTF